jgi:serine/threonine-protein kinase
MTTLARGDRVGKYEILTPLATGGMAELFIGSTVGPGGFQKHVIIKRILPDASREETFVRMFLDEARITAAFSHPNIAQVFDLGEDELGLYVVMEFVPGQNLNQVVSRCAHQRRVLPLGYSISVINDCAQALHYAHTFINSSGESYPVIHRDVAQKNIMVGWDGRTKLLDFGIAKAANALARTKVGTIKGTAGYMAPEQVRGEHVDGRADVFSLGVVAWELCTGQRLFSAETELAEMKLVLEGTIERPDTIEPVVPPELGDVVMRALKKDASDRYPSAKEFAKALSRECQEWMFDSEQKSQFMRELFADRIEKTQRLFDLAKSDGPDVEAEVRQLAKSIQENAMSQPVLNKVSGRSRAKPKKKNEKKHRSAEDEKLLALAIQVDQMTAQPTHETPRRTWATPILLVCLAMVTIAIGYRILFPEQRTSRSGLKTWQNEEEEDPSVTVRTGSLEAANVPGVEALAVPKAIEPVASPIEATPQKEVPKDPKPIPETKKKETRSVPTGDVTLAILPEASVFRGRDRLAQGSLVTLSLPVGTHMLTVIGPDAIRRQLSVRVANGKNPPLRLRLEDIPAQASSVK